MALDAAQLGVSIWMTCAEDGREHAVTDPAFVPEHQAGQGTYRAVCHHLGPARATGGVRGHKCQLHGGVGVLPLSSGLAVIEGKGVVVRGTGRVTGRVAAATALAPPGGYGDGPVHVRVEKELAGSWRPPFDYRVECNDWRCTWDPTFDYIEIENTHNAFLYVTEMIRRGIPAAALAVVRLTLGNES